MEKDKRRKDRRVISYYLPILEAGSQKPIGIMMDISPRGLRIDCRTLIPEGQVNHMRINLAPEMTPKTSLEFFGRAKWCRPDNYDPSLYNAGFEVFDISPVDALLYNRISIQYGLSPDNGETSSADYLWK